MKKEIPVVAERRRSQDRKRDVVVEISDILCITEVVGGLDMDIRIEGVQHRLMLTPDSFRLYYVSPHGEPYGSSKFVLRTVPRISHLSPVWPIRWLSLSNR